MADRLAWRPWLVMLGGLVGVRLALMAGLPLTDTSEPRYAEIARLMVQTGDWITPWFSPGVPFWGKPPLAFWASALSFQVFGVSAIAARLPSLLAMLGVGVLTYRWARAWFGTMAARIATLVLASSLLPFVAAGAVLTDAWLCLAVVLGIAGFVLAPEARSPGRRYAAFVGAAIGLLAKGPLALVLIGAVVLPWAAWHRRLGRHLRALPWLGGTLIVLVLVVPWYVLAEWKTPGFLRYFLVGEHLARFLDPGWTGDRYGTAHQRLYGAIWADWWLASLPWGPLALVLAVRARVWRGLPARLARRGDARLTLLLMWALAAPAFFTFSGNILWTYVLPGLPALAMLIGWGASAAAAVPGRFAHGGFWLAGLVPAGALVLGVAVSLAPDLVRSEADLVAYHAQAAQAGQPLFYVDSRPFSARFYSADTAGLVGSDEVPTLRDRARTGVFLAIPREIADDLRATLGQPRVLFENRRYVLAYLDVPERRR